MGCSICGRPATTRGWCRLHYQRWRRYGDPMRERPTVQHRIASRTDRTPSCWLWTGAADQNGYGVIKVDRVLQRVTRVVWADAHGAIPAGLAVLHACDNPPCIRPDHLMLGTQRANVRDALNKRRRPQNERAA